METKRLWSDKCLNDHLLPGVRRTGNRCSSPISIHPKMHAKMSDPGPTRDLIYKKKQLPVKRNTASMTVGYVSIYVNHRH